MNKLILVFLGPPGSGKGTQAKMISERFNIPVVSTGEMMRQEIKKKTAIGKKIESILASGNLASDDLTEELLDQRLVKKDARGGYILDGFPRNSNQLKLALARFKKTMSSDDKLLAIYIKVSDKEVVNRLGGRRVCVCGETYHIKFNPPKKDGACDKCGKKLFQRNDDKPKVIKERLEVYYKGVSPIIEYFKKSGQLIEINGEQKIPKVQKDILKGLKKEKVN